MRDGETIHFRPIRPDDADLEQRFFERVGTDSAYYRFFQSKSYLSPKELKYFTNVDYDNRMAFIAVHGDDMVAVGRYDVLPDESGEIRKVAEIALLVEDDFQGHGIGSRLLHELIAYARLQGVTDFVAFVLAENGAVFRLLRNTGYKLTRRFHEGIYRVEFSLE